MVCYISTCSEKAWKKTYAAPSETDLGDMTCCKLSVARLSLPALCLGCTEHFGWQSVEVQKTAKARDSFSVAVPAWTRTWGKACSVPWAVPHCTWPSKPLLCPSHQHHNTSLTLFLKHCRSQVIPITSAFPSWPRRSLWNIPRCQKPLFSCSSP